MSQTEELQEMVLRSKEPVPLSSMGVHKTFLLHRWGHLHFKGVDGKVYRLNDGFSTPVNIFSPLIEVIPMNLYEANGIKTNYF